MIKKYKWLLCVLAVFVLFCAAAVSAYAVPELPGTWHAQPSSCRSHPGDLVTLDDIPAQRGGAKQSPSLTPAVKNIPLVTIVIGFDNIDYDAGFDWSGRLFTGEKSLSAYYSDMSFGKFTFVPAQENSAFGVDGNTNTADAPDDGIIHVRVALPHKDWDSEDEYPALAEAFRAAIGEADRYIDFSAYDTDGNGEITNNELALSFVAAGYEASEAYSYPYGKELYLWAHAWSFTDLYEVNNIDLPAPDADGVAIDAYISVAEKLNDGTQEPISVLAHELGHYLGLPDLYDTKYQKGNRYEWGRYSVSYLSVMCDGSWGTDPEGGYIPYSMDAWSRYILGWFEPQNAAADGSYAVAAQSFEGDQSFAALKIPTQRAGEYYLLENRSFEKWDAGLAGEYDDGGVILWHIDDAVYDAYEPKNEVNNVTHRPAVMPLYPEWNGEAYCFIGKNQTVYTDMPFYSAAAWQEIGEDCGESLDLPLYGEGENADLRSARTLSGIRLSFPENPSARMTVVLDMGAHTHSLTLRQGTPAGCETEGVSDCWVCGLCGELFADESGEVPVAQEDLIIPAAGHRWGAWNITLAAQCETKGRQERVCSSCGKKQTKAIDALGHSEPDADGVCTRCGEQIAAPQVVENLCKYCGKNHDGQPFGKLIQVFHNILQFFRTLFGG